MALLLFMTDNSNLDPVENLSEHVLPIALQPIDNMSFEDFLERVDKEKAGSLLQAIYDAEKSEPSRIQCQVIPYLIDGNDKHLVAQAQSGSGKTMSFLIPAMLKIDKSNNDPQVLIISHIRELILQTRDVFLELNKYLEYSYGICVKESPIPFDGKGNILFGSAASVLYSAKREKKIDISKLKFIIVDEADEIMHKNSSHYGSVTQILNEAKNAQLAFFSATYPKTIIEFCQKLRPSIKSITIPRNEQVTTIQHFYTISENPVDALPKIFSSIAVKQTYVFVRSKDDAKKVYEILSKLNLNCKFLSSELPTLERDSVLNSFRKEDFSILITTNLLARGIDVPSTSLVICLDVPKLSLNKGQPNVEGKYKSVIDIDTYVHRAGRAGRFGKIGSCITIIRNENGKRVFEIISKQTGIDIKQLNEDQFNILEDK